MIVADTNLIVYHALETPFTIWSKKWAQADPEWYVPSIWQFEFVNAVVTHTRLGKLARLDAEKIIAETIDAFSVNQVDVNQSEVFIAAMRYRISAYDANFIVLAEKLGTFCVTGDKQMLERAPGFTKALDSLRSR